MYGTFIGDIVGSKYKFNNIKTKCFPLFSQGCGYTDVTIMTLAVAKAVMLSYEEQHEKNNRGECGKPFQKILIETMQDFGRRYPSPMGAYGGKFAHWLSQKDPMPYGSCGNGAAMRVSPCALAAVTLEEALAMARASACVTHDHPEGIKGAEAVCAAIFMAKYGESKEAIRQYISEHYYDLNFTLDSIRDSYRYHSSCQRSVPQAIVAFLESESFEDAIRNAVSIGGDCNTIAAITGSIAWIHYAGYWQWASGELKLLDSSMREARAQALAYLPQELIDVRDAFMKRRGLRAAAFDRIGFCTPMLNGNELWKYYWTNWGLSSDQDNDDLESMLRETMTEFCSKYVVLMKILYRDRELNQWCRSYSADGRNTKCCELEKAICDGFVRDTVASGYMPLVLSRKPYTAYRLETALAGTPWDLLHGIYAEIQLNRDSDALIRHAIADGNLYRLMDAYLSSAQAAALAKASESAQRPTSATSPLLTYPQYTLEYIDAQKRCPEEKRPGGCRVWHDQSEHKWSLQFQLDEEALWFLSVFVRDDGSFDSYWLDEEAADDSHYAFAEEQMIRARLYAAGDENRYFHEILIRFVERHGGGELLSLIEPYITNQLHFY